MSTRLWNTRFYLVNEYKALPDYFEKVTDFENTIKDWLEYKAG